MSDMKQPSPFDNGEPSPNGQKTFFPGNTNPATVARVVWEQIQARRREENDDKDYDEKAAAYDRLRQPYPLDNFELELGKQMDEGEMETEAMGDDGERHPSTIL